MGKYRCMGCMNEYDDSISVCPYCGHVKNSKPSNPCFLTPETVLDNRYIVGKAIGRGAFNVTYLAWDFTAGCKVVIKEFFPSELATRTFGQKELSVFDGEKQKEFESGLYAFVQESERIAALSGRGYSIADVKGVFIENSTAYRVIEFIDGITLENALKNGKMRWNDVLTIMYPLIETLSTLHNENILNCDISPDNIIITRDRSVKLLDFSAYRFYGDGNNKNLSTVAKSGFAPEELYRDRVVATPATDVYSLAATMYYAVTGQLPPLAVERVAKDKLVPPSKLGAKISESAETALLNALNVNCSCRTESCGAFLAELESKTPVKRRADKKIKTENTGKLSKRSKVFISMAIILVVGVIAAVLLIRLPNINKTTDGISVPDFKNMTVEQAQKEAAGLGLKEEQIKIVKVSDSNKEVDKKVISQDVEAGSRVPEKSLGEFKIVLRVAVYNKDADKLAESLVEMPDLYGLTPKQANKKLKKAGFLNEIVVEDEKYSDTVKAGRIVFQADGNGDPVAPGSKITAGDTIHVTLSKGAKPTEPPTTKANPTAPVPNSSRATTERQTTAPTTVPSAAPPTTKADDVVIIMD